jgi:hypothetical protein
MAALDSLVTRFDALERRADGGARADDTGFSEGSRNTAQRMVNAENDMIDAIARMGAMSTADSRKAFEKLKEVRALKLDAVGGKYKVTHGAYMERDVLRRAAGLENKGRHDADGAKYSTADLVRMLRASGKSEMAKEVKGSSYKGVNGRGKETYWIDYEDAAGTKQRAQLFVNDDGSVHF